MSQHYVRFLEVEELTIGAIYDGPQDPDFVPFQGVVEDDDPRYLSFLLLTNPPPAEVEVISPVDKLKAFLEANPDVAAILK